MLFFAFRSTLCSITQSPPLPLSLRTWPRRRQARTPLPPTPCRPAAALASSRPATLTGVARSLTLPPALAAALAPALAPPPPAPPHRTHPRPPRPAATLTTPRPRRRRPRRRHRLCPLPRRRGPASRPRHPCPHHPPSTFRPRPCPHSPPPSAPLPPRSPLGSSSARRSSFGRSCLSEGVCVLGPGVVFLCERECATCDFRGLGLCVYVNGNVPP